MKAGTFKNRLIFCTLAIVLLLTSIGQASQEPIDDYNTALPITGTFGEYRDIDRFHKGIDIGRSTGTLVYPAENGFIKEILYKNTVNEQVRIIGETSGKVYRYIHINVDPNLSTGTVVTSTNSIGVILDPSRVGLNISNYSMNYAVVPYSDLGNTQRVSISASY